jgi:hypothetical protein
MEIAPPSPEFVDHQVQRLAAYLQGEDWMRRRMIEEQNWGELYEKMFFQFYECAGKTSSWGNTSNWDQDWKPICQCTEFWQRPVVLIDLLSWVPHQNTWLVKRSLTFGFALNLKHVSRIQSSFVIANTIRYGSSRWGILVDHQSTLAPHFPFDCCDFIT